MTIGEFKEVFTDDYIYVVEYIEGYIGIAKIEKPSLLYDTEYNDMEISEIVIKNNKAYCILKTSELTN